MTIAAAMMKRDGDVLRIWEWVCLGVTHRMLLDIGVVLRIEENNNLIFN